MKKTITAIMLTLAFIMTVQTAKAEEFAADFQYNLRLGYMLGGTSPIGLPATIRSLDKYRMEPTMTLGIDVNKPITGRWGLTTGLRLENKGMNLDATVKNYHMAFVQGTQRLEGNFTGGVNTKVEEWMITIPMMLSYAITDNLHVKGGMFASILTKASFEGYAYNGYLRVGNPTGSKVEIGSDETNHGDYDFSSDMRRVHWGFLIGADYYWGRHWGAFVDLTWGMTGIFKSSFKTIDQTLYPIYGSIGLSYRLK